MQGSLRPCVYLVVLFMHTCIHTVCPFESYLRDIYEQVLISFRKVLCSQLSADDMLKIVKSLTLGDGGPGKANQAARAGAWSGAGAGELEVYVTTTCLYAQLRGLLVKCVVAG